VVSKHLLELIYFLLVAIIKMFRSQSVENDVLLEDRSHNCSLNILTI